MDPLGYLQPWTYTQQIDISILFLSAAIRIHLSNIDLAHLRFASEYAPLLAGVYFGRTQPRVWKLGSGPSSGSSRMRCGRFEVRT